MEPGFDLAEVEADASGTELEVGHAALESVGDGASGQAEAEDVGPQVGREKWLQETDTQTDTNRVVERGGRVGDGRLDFLEKAGINALSVGVYTPIPTLASSILPKLCRYTATTRPLLG